MSRTAASGGAARFVAVRAADRDEAERVVGDLFLANRLSVSGDSGRFEMTLTAAQFDGLTVGRLGYGEEARLLTEEPSQFHINTPLSGRAVSRAGSSEPVPTVPGQAALFSPGDEADIRWTADCVQMCLMMPRGDLESTMERLLGRSLTRPLRFEPVMDLSTPMARSWRDSVEAVSRDFERGAGLATHPVTAKHVREMLLDGLLLGHRHNYTSELSGLPTSAPSNSVARAVDLLQERPEAPWSSTTLARDVHLSVRALQEGFRRDVGRSPMSYLRDVRLRRVHEDLRAAAPYATTVEALALRWGFVHMGRFAAAYRDAFGRPPSATLRDER